MAAGLWVECEPPASPNVALQEEHVVRLKVRNEGAGEPNSGCGITFFPPAGGYHKIKMELGAAEARNAGRSNGEKSKTVGAAGKKTEQKNGTVMPC